MRKRNETSEQRERRLAKAREYTEAHKEEIAAYQKKWKADNLARRIEYNNEWRRRNPDLNRKYYNATNRKKRMRPEIRVSESIASQIRIALRGKKNGWSWEKLVGYTRCDLIAHLEARFTEGMTWDNYGEWHIDHVRPQDSFSFTSVDDDDFKACWALMNLQPLWAADNIRKGNRLS